MKKLSPSISWVTIVALVLFGGFVMVAWISHAFFNTERAQREMASAEVATLHHALDRFCVDCGRMPTNEEGLLVLLSGSGIKGWRGPYLEQIPPDPWGNEYVYWNLGRNEVKVASLGEDGKLGGEAGTTNEDVGDVK